MLIINEPTPPATLAARRVVNRINSAYKGLTDAIQQSVADLYDDPTQTQAVLDALGNRAGIVFGLSNVAVGAINAAVTLTGEGQTINSVIPPGHVVTINPDGTATDTYTPPPPEDTLPSEAE